MFLLFDSQALVERLLSKTTDNSLLISRFQEFLEMEDVRYYVMSSVRENVGKVMDKNKGVGEICSVLSSSAIMFFFLKTCSLWTVLRLLNSVTLSWSFQAVVPIYQGNVFTLMSNISVPSKESELTNFMVKQEGGMSCLRLFLLCWTVTVWVFFFVNKCDVIFFFSQAWGLESC